MILPNNKKGPWGPWGLKPDVDGEMWLCLVLGNKPREIASLKVSKTRVSDIEDWVATAKNHLGAQRIFLGISL